MKQHIEEAIHNFRTAGTRYQKPERYYRGQHDLAFATEKFENAFGSLFREFAMNLCPAVCDAIRDKLRITGFQVQSPSFSLPGANEQASGSSAHAEACTLNIWRRNRMQLRAGEIHREALVSGDAYAIVWPDEDGQVAIYPNRATNVTVTYDEDRPGRITRAAKFWRTADKHTRLNLFYPDRIERYITAKPGEGTLPEAKEFVPFVDRVSSPTVREGIVSARRALPNGRGTDTPTIDTTHHIIANPYNLVPVFHFANNADIGAFGRSELESAIPVQDGLNKSVLDMLVAMEYSAFRQRWVAGLEVQEDADGKAISPFETGVNNLWTTPNDKAQFGDFNTTDLDQFLKVKDSFRIDMASVTGTPMYYLLPHTRGFPSGEAMQRAESRFIAKVRDRQSAFGQVWSDIMQFAALIDRWPGRSADRNPLGRPVPNHRTRTPGNDLVKETHRPFDRASSSRSRILMIRLTPSGILSACDPRGKAHPGPAGHETKTQNMRQDQKSRTESKGTIKPAVLPCIDTENDKQQQVGKAIKPKRAELDRGEGQTADRRWQKVDCRHKQKPFVVSCARSVVDRKTKKDGKNEYIAERDDQKRKRINASRSDAVPGRLNTGRHSDDDHNGGKPDTEPAEPHMERNAFRADQIDLHRKEQDPGGHHQAVDVGQSPKRCRC